MWKRQACLSLLKMNAKLMKSLDYPGKEWIFSLTHPSSKGEKK
jgi:hypothetical protein